MSPAFADPPDQLGCVVPDLQAAIAEWAAQGVGPFLVMRNVTIGGYVYEGRPSKPKINVAFSQQGDLQIELIQQHNDAPSAFRDSFPDGPVGGEGSHHHLGMLNDDYEKCFNDCVARGYVPATSGCFNGTHFAHFDTRSTFGFMTELTEATPDILDFYRRVADAASGWDGNDPVRPI